MPELLASLLGAGHERALAARGSLPGLALAAKNEARRSAGLPPYASVEAWLAELAPRTVCLSLLAGSGSRWLRSLEAARARVAAGTGGSASSLDAQASAFDPARPRGLFPVRNLLVPGGPRIAVAAYALAAVKGLGRHVLVVRGWEAEIDAEVLAPLGIGSGARAYQTQGAELGKPLGHGDAAWQARGLWSKADYVITNFGGDANSRRTAINSLLALDAFGAPGGAGADLIIPVARIANPAYPVALDAEGIPRGFGHAKLQGQALGGGSGYTNVGLRVYRAGALLEKVEAFRSRHWVEGSGYAIPGNDPAGHEFALDNVDAALASEGRARILAASLPQELTPAKSLEEVPAFEEAVAAVVADDREEGKHGATEY
ncbi:MAG TPA: hypothetical protein VFL04_04320 [Rectinemataceae bacterium]|nr:hypothetical protein [Rectinemataceae bacterium]